MQKFFNKSISYVFILVLCFAFVLQPSNSYAKEIETKAESAIIVDVNTGKILYAKNKDDALPPASMTKMMTEYLVLEKIAQGEIDWETTTEISDFVYEISANNAFSGIGLRKDVDYTVKALYEAMAINSDNATTIALAELISGSEGEFVKLMNEKAKELGLPDATFVNSTGLDNDSMGGKHPEGTNANDTNLMSAESAALLAYHIIKDFPEALDISSVPTTKFDGHDIVNWNWMLPHKTEFLEDFYYEGVDGIKTGHTDLAGYNFTSTAQRNDRRLITVVMKTASVEERFKETAKLLDYGFSQFEEVELFKAGYQIKNESVVPVAKGKEKSVEVALDQAFTTPIKKGTEEDYSVVYELDAAKLTEDGELTAPLEKGEKVGVAKLIYQDDATFDYVTDDKEITVDLVTTEEVKKKNWFSLTLDAIGNFFKSVVNKIKNLF